MRTINTLVLVFTVALITMPVISNGANLDVGIQAGFCMTQGNYDFDLYDSQSKYGPGFYGGLTTTLVLPNLKKFGFETGVFLWQRGGETDFEMNSTDQFGDILWERTDTYDWRLSYLTIPISARYSFSEDGEGFYLKAGGEIAFLLKAELEYPDYDMFSQVEPDAEIKEKDVKDDFKNYDISAIGGFGYSFPLEKMKGFIELSFIFGFMDVLDPSDVVLNAKIRNRSFGVSGGIHF